MTDSLYTYLLAIAFTTFQSARIFSYLPTLRMLMRADSSAKSYSLWTWGLWVGANLTQTLTIYEQTGVAISMLVLTNAVNTIMCALVMIVVIKVKNRETMPRDDIDHDDGALEKLRLLFNSVFKIGRGY